jgi:hypothetical protein
VFWLLCIRLGLFKHAVSESGCFTVAGFNQTGNVHNVTMGRDHNKFCSHGKAISMIYFECVFVALVIQHAEHICHIILSVDCLSLHISTSSHKWNDFQKKLLHLKCVLIFSATFI